MAQGEAGKAGGKMRGQEEKSAHQKNNQKNSAQFHNVPRRQ
jgi:hypothetical protein